MEVTVYPGHFEVTTNATSNVQLKQPLANTRCLDFITVKQVCVSQRFICQCYTWGHY